MQEPKTNLSQDDLLMLLKRGSDEWNRWREEHPSVIPDLSGIDLSELELSKANFRNANLRGADLSHGTFFLADFSHADLQRADCIESNFRRCDFTDATLDEANLDSAELKRACLCDASCIGTKFEHSDLSEADVAKLKYDRRKMMGKYRGIRGLDSTFGNALWRRDAMDQDYIDSLKYVWSGKSVLNRALFKAWALTDFGRSVWRVGLLAVVCIAIFAFAYYFLQSDLDIGSASELSLPDALYFSVVVFTTLGFGDIAPETQITRLFVAIEVIMGYITLGLLMALISNTVTRRA